MTVELSVPIIIQLVSFLVTIGIFIGVSKTNAKNVKDELIGFQTRTENSVAELKEDLAKLGEKFDKHNNECIKDLEIAKQGTKSAHKRIDDHCRGHK